MCHPPEGDGMLKNFQMVYMSMHPHKGTGLNEVKRSWTDISHENHLKVF